MGICDDDNASDLDTGLVPYAEMYCSSSGDSRVGILIWYGLWLVLLISLLATTADRHFVPQLQWLSNFLRLRPEVAGITLLAIGNGAPDVFTALAGIADAGDFQLVVGALLGASTFISTVVLGAVLLSARNPRKATIARITAAAAGDMKDADFDDEFGPLGGGDDAFEESIDEAISDFVEVDASAFLRDVVAYIVGTSTILIISLDGKIYIYEALSLLGIYLVYVTTVIVRSGFRTKEEVAADAEQALLGPNTGGLGGNAVQNTDADQDDEEENCCTGQNGPLALEGIPVPPLNDPSSNWAGISDYWNRVQWLIEWPFSVLRWLTIPEADGEWGTRQTLIAAVAFPCGIYLVYVDFVANAVAWDGTATIMVAVGAGLGLIVLVANCMRAGSNGKIPPRWYWATVAWALVTTIVWLDQEAGEAVALAGTLGGLASVSSSVMGITVLAWGNSVGDLVADTAAARVTPKMAVATCFGSPMLNDLIGLGLSLTVTTAGKSDLSIDVSLSTELYVAWGFLYLALFCSLSVYYLYGGKLPRRYAYVLFAIYGAFLVAQTVLLLNNKLDSDGDDSD